MIEEHDREFIEPNGDAIRAFLPKDKAVLILMDEIISYFSTYRGRGYWLFDDRELPAASME